LSTCADELVALGVNHLTVLPLFLGVGKHAREDLPVLVAELQLKHPLVVINLRPAVGEDAQMIDLMARIALS
jgi:sirohydrochlorin cobaltochelatase